MGRTGEYDFIAADGGLVTFNSKFVGLFNRAGLGSYKDLIAHAPGRQIGSHLDRPVYEFELEGSGFFIKKTLKPYVKDSLAGIGRKKDSSAGREWRAIQALAAAGVSSVVPVAFGERFSGGVEKDSFIVTLRAEGVSLLPDYLAGGARELSRSERLKSLKVFAEAVARMHEGGVQHRALYAKHCFIRDTDMGLDLTLFDLAGAQLRKITPYLAAQDLGCLSASIPFGLSSRHERLRFLLTYEGKSRPDHETRKLAKLVDKRRLKLAGRRRFLTGEERASGKVSFKYAGRGLKKLEGVFFAADDSFRLFADSGLESFEALFEGTKAELLRDVGVRANYRLTLDTPGGERRYYLKVHKGAKSSRQGVDEMINAIKFGEAAIPAYRPVACGRDPEKGSFFISEDVRGGDQLDHYVANHGAPRLFKKKLIHAVAELAGRMHRLGFYHRDFYLCHIFITPGDAGDFELKIIDLQRVGEMHPVSDRRIIKDVAALDYSADRPLFSSHDRLRFLKIYLIAAGLDWPVKKAAARIRRKTARISRHDAKSKRKRPLQEIEEVRAAAPPHTDDA